MPIVLGNELRKKAQANAKKQKKKDNKKAASTKKAASSSTPKTPAVRGNQKAVDSSPKTTKKKSTGNVKNPTNSAKISGAASGIKKIFGGTERNARDIQQARKQRDTAKNDRDAYLRKSYELRRKNTGEYANKVNRAHVRGFAYDTNPYAGSEESRRNYQTFFVKRFGAGAWSVPEGIGKTLEAGSSTVSDKQRQINPRGGRYNQTALDVRERARQNNVRNGDRYERFTENLNKDPRANTLSSQLAEGMGRLAVEAPLYAFGGGAGAAAKAASTANKGLKALKTVGKAAAKPLTAGGAGTLTNAMAYFGERFDEAQKKGATPAEAAKAAAAYALPMAYTEGLGGAENALSKVMKPGTSAIKTAAKSGISEALEEAAQTPWEQGTRKLYGENIPLFGRGNQDAIINPSQIANSALVGGILGAAGGGVAGGRANARVNAAKQKVEQVAKEWDSAIDDMVKQGIIDNVAAIEAKQQGRRWADNEINNIDRAVRGEQIKTDTNNFGGEYNDNTPVEGYANAPNEEGYTDEDNYAVDEIFNAKEDPEAKARRETEEQERLLFEQQGIDYDNDPFYNGETEEDIEGNATSQDEKTADVAPPKRYVRKGAETPSVLHTDTRPPNRYVRKGAETLREIYQDGGRLDYVDAITQGIESGDPDYTYTAKQTDKWSLERAAENLRDFNNVRDAVSYVTDQINSNNGNTTKVIDAELMLLMREADAAGDVESLRNLWGMSNKAGTETARALQGRKMMRLLTPDGRAVVNEMDMERKAARAAGFDTVEIKNLVEGNKTNDVRQMFVDFAEGNDATETRTTPNDRYTLRNRVRTAIEKRSIKKNAASNGSPAEITDISKANIKRLVGQALKENPNAFEEALQHNNIDDAIFALTKQISKTVNPNGDENIDSQIFGMIQADITERMRKYRDKKLKDLLGETGRAHRTDRKKSDFLRRLIEYNNLGYLDDPETANNVYKAMTVPYLSNEEFTAMINLHDLSQKVEDGQITEIVQDEKNTIDKKTADILNRKLEKGDTEYVARALEERAQKIAEDKLVGNTWQKLRQAQITAMLGNVRTMLRNFAPNLAMMPVNQAGRVGGAIADKILAKQTGVRTVGAPVNPLQAAKDMGTGLYNAAQDYRLGIDTSTNNKTELTMRHAFSNDNLFGRGMNRATDLVNFGLKTGDMPFENVYYNQSLQKQMALNDVNEPTELMKEIAQLEAMQRTFKDENAFTEFTQKFIDTLNIIGGGKGAYGLGSVLVPFVRTPANLTKLMVEYAPPTALVKAGVDYYKYKNAAEGDEKIRLQNRFANSVSHLVSGTLLTAFMYILKGLNLVEITGGADDDDWQQTEYDKQVHGKQEYAIRIGDKWFNYENLQPVGSLMALAVDSYDYIFGNNDPDMKGLQRIANGLVNGLFGAGDMLYESSIYKGIGDLFRGKDKITESIAGLIGNVPQQFVPALVQQFAKTVDPWQRDTTSDNEFAPFRILEESERKMLSTIPFLSYLLPKKTDAYGLPMERYDTGTVGDILNAFVNPFTMTQNKAGNFSSIESTEEKVRLAKAIEEIERVNGVYTSEYGLLPTTSKRTIRIGNENVRLTGEERQKWQKDAGYEYLKSVAGLIDDPAYNSLSDTEKGKVLENTKTALRAQAKANIAKAHNVDYKLDKKYQKAIDANEVGLSVGQYYSQMKAMQAVGSQELPENDYRSSSDLKRGYILDDSGMTDEQIVYCAQAFNLMNKKWVDEMEAAELQGIDNITYLRAKSEMNILRNSRDLDKRGKEAAAVAIAQEYGKTGDQQQWILSTLSNMGMYLPDNDIKNVDLSAGGEYALIDAFGKHTRDAWEGNDKYCAGLSGQEEFDSIEQFAMAMDMVEGSKKDEKIASIDQLNLTANQKKIILACKGNQSKGVTFQDGGSVDVPSSAVDIKIPSKKNNNISNASVSTSASAPATTKKSSPVKNISSIPGGSGVAAAVGNIVKNTAEKTKETIEKVMQVRPVTYEGARISSGFGHRESPGGIGSTNHKGVDIAVDGLSDVGAVAFVPGTITYVGKRGGLGNVVEYLADDGNYITLAHLDSISKGLTPGEKVWSGTQVGVVGDTGTTTGKCLHIEVRPGGTRDSDPVDPETVYDLLGNGLKTPSTDSDYQASSAYSSSSSSSSSSDSSSSSGGGGGGGKVKRKKKSTYMSGSGYGSYTYGGYTPSTYSGGYTPGTYTPGSYNP